MIRNSIEQQMYRLAPGEKRDCLSAVAIRSRKEVAEIMGVTVQAVQQMERKALYKMRHRMRELMEEFRNQ